MAQSNEEILRELKELKSKLSQFNSKRLYEDKNKEEAFRMFKLFDVDNSDDINAKEFQELAFQLGETLTKEEVAQTIKQIDTDNSGTVSFEEFYAWWTSEDHEKLKKSRNPEQLKKMKALKAKLQSQAYMNNVLRFIEAAQKGARQAAAEKERLASVKFGINVNLGQVKKAESSIQILHKNDAKAASSLKTEVGFPDQNIVLSLAMSGSDDSTEADLKELANGISENLKPLQKEEKLFKKFKVDCGTSDGERVIFVHFAPGEDRELKELVELVESLQIKNFGAQIKFNQPLLDKPGPEPLAVNISAELETTRTGAKVITSVFDEAVSSSSSRRRRKRRGYGDDDDENKKDYWGKLAKLSATVNVEDISSVLKGLFILDEDIEKLSLGNVDFGTLGFHQLKPLVAYAIHYVYAIAEEEDIMKPFIPLYEKFKGKLKGIHSVKAILGDIVVQLKVEGFDLGAFFFSKEEADSLVASAKEKYKAAVKELEKEEGGGSDDEKPAGSGSDDEKPAGSGSGEEKPADSGSESEEEPSKPKKKATHDSDSGSASSDEEIQSYAKKIGTEVPASDSDYSSDYSD